MLESFGTLGTIIILLLVAAVLFLAIITFSMSMRLTKLTQKYKLFMKDSDGQSMEKALTYRFKELDKLSDTSLNNEVDLKILKKKLGGTLTHYGVVKYDAFDDVGGKMSFALAMLDNSNSGFILNTVHSRDNCFVYFKEIVNGESYIMLSNEEIEALKQASSTIEEENL